MKMMIYVIYIGIFIFFCESKITIDLQKIEQTNSDFINHHRILKNKRRELLANQTTPSSVTSLTNYQNVIFN